MTATRDDLFETLESFVTRLFSLAQSEATDLLVELDLSITQARVLFVLGHTKEPTAINEIAKRLGLSVASAGRNIDALHRLGIVERQESPEDRRVKLVSLSDKGWQIADVHFEQKRRALREFTERVPETQALDLTNALKPILAGSSLTQPDQTYSQESA